MIKFLLHLSFIVIMVAVTFYPIVASGEMCSISYVVMKQDDAEENILFGLGYTDRNVYYKMQSTIRRDPEVLALGSSRVMQIRKDFFSEPELFYNAGGAARDAAEMQCFLEQLPENNRLKLVIIGIDQWSYNYNYTGELSGPEPLYFTDTTLNKTLDFKNTLSKIIDDYINQKLRLSQLVVNTNRIGVNAKVNENGFLNDGSYYYGSRFSEKNNPDQHWFEDTFQRIENGDRRFEYGYEVNEKAVEQMDAFLKYCRQRNIYVIGFEPPFPSSVLQRMSAKGDDYSYIDEIPKRMEEVFEKYQFEFYDYSDVGGLGCGADSYFIDGFHGGDAVYALMFQDMLTKSSHLGIYCEEASLSTLYHDRDSDVAVYGSYGQY